MIYKLIRDRAFVESEAQKLPLPSQLEFYNIKPLIEEMSLEQAKTAVLGLLVFNAQQQAMTREVLSAKFKASFEEIPPRNL